MPVHAVLEHYCDSTKIGSVKTFHSPTFKFGTSSSFLSVLFIARIGDYIYLVILNLR